MVGERGKSKSTLERDAKHVPKTRRRRRRRRRVHALLRPPLSFLFLPRQARPVRSAERKKKKTTRPQSLLLSFDASYSILWLCSGFPVLGVYTAGSGIFFISAKRIAVIWMSESMLARSRRPSRYCVMRLDTIQVVVHALYSVYGPNGQAWTRPECHFAGTIDS